MAERDASRVQLDFPQLVADIIRQLNLTGTVGILDFSDQVTPVYIVASREGALTVTVTPPVFASAQITSGAAANPAANLVIGDTGVLPAGDYDIFAGISIVGATNVGANTACVLQHRNAANDTTLATLLSAGHTGAGVTSMHSALAPIVYTLGLNERLRFINLNSSLIGHIGTTVAAAIRPTP